VRGGEGRGGAEQGRDGFLGLFYLVILDA